MARRKKNSGPTPIEVIKHADRRVNIPTEELRDFVAGEEKRPEKVLYPRDESLDPQLVWKGKDEQDREDLAVPAVPIYIQEKIHPRVIIENLRETARAGEPEPELTLFNDFNGIESFDKLVEFYQHEQNWANRMILGDSLLVMTSLAEKEGLKGKVQMIYMDPPYGIKFGSNWQVSTRKRDVKDGKVEDATRQPEQVKAFRDTWELGIHSYLAYLRDRLTIARDLLSETGSIFVQIGDENVHLVRCVMDEVFGSENFCALIVARKSGGTTSELLASPVDYLLWYGRCRERTKYRRLFQQKTGGSEGAGVYSRAMSPDGADWRKLTPGEMADPSLVPEGWRVFRVDVVTSQGFRTHTTAPFEFEGKTYHPGANSNWKATLEGMGRLASAGRLFKTGSSLGYVRYVDDFPVYSLDSVWEDTGTGSFTDPKVFVVQTGTKMISRCMLMTTDPGDLVLDPTCGSGTTAYVAEQWGRRWITIDTSRVALTLARTRLMAGRFPYYLLADSEDGARREAEQSGLASIASFDGRHDHDVRKGFVYKRVPHITLKSIANNPDIHEGMTREEIDAAIARHADTELLYDQPYEDSGRIRVTGPFTMESLSPHRVVSGEGAEQAGDAADPAADGRFETIILDHLKKAGVQNTFRNERLVFDRLEPYAGTWLQATGEYTDSGGATRSVAVSIGAEYGTVGPDQIKEAVKEAVQGIGFDVLIVCGFAFDPHVSEESKRYGDLQVLITRMNPDLAMGDELLKKTGAGNLFMVFGEPDIEVRTVQAPTSVSTASSTTDSERTTQLEVEIRGLDVYDPTTGEIRSSSTDDIACWFIDTDYNGESFFVRHAYFTGADDPYKKLQRALRAEIDEEAWGSLYSSVSRPFDPPSTGKIAVKVINHYGDEVLKVFPCCEYSGQTE